MTIDDWLESACADADRRGLEELKPLLTSLADATRALREAGWHESVIPPTEAGVPVSLGPGPPPEHGAAQ